MHLALATAASDPVNPFTYLGNALPGGQWTAAWTACAIFAVIAIAALIVDSSIRSEHLGGVGVCCALIACVCGVFALVSGSSQEYAAAQQHERDIVQDRFGVVLMKTAGPEQVAPYFPQMPTDESEAVSVKAKINGAVQDCEVHREGDAYAMACRLDPADVMVPLAPRS